MRDRRRGDRPRPRRLRGAVRSSIHQAGWGGRAGNTAPRTGSRHFGSPAPTRWLLAAGVVPVPQARFVGEIGDGMRRALGPQRRTGPTATRPWPPPASSSSQAVATGRSSMARPAGLHPRHESAHGLRRGARCRRGGDRARGRCGPTRTVRPRVVPRRTARAGSARGRSGTRSCSPTTRHRWTPSSLADIDVLATVVGGEVVGRRSGTR